METFFGDGFRFDVLRRVSSLHAAGTHSQSGAEPDGGTLRVRGREPGRRADAVLHPATSPGGTDREGRGDEEGRCRGGSGPGAGPGGRGEGGEHAGGHRGPGGGRRARLRRGPGDGGGRFGDAEETGREGWGSG